jgi:hypothetical protein
MENQHRLIQGYRDLSKAEVDLMNEVKAKGYELAGLLAKVRLHVINQDSQQDKDRHADSEPMRWLARAKTSAQDAVMQAVRAVAQPDDGF